MFISRWIIAFAFGLILVTSGQAQEQAGSTERQTDAQSEPPYLFSRPLAVDLIEDEATTEARQRSEEEARQREIADLVAQEGMNASTKSIEQATRDMRDYALYSTIAVWIGTALLFYTLWLTRQANRAAMSAVEITRNLGIAEHRPYVQSYISGPISHIHTPTGDMFWRMRVMVSNSGSTPTKGLTVRRFYKICDAVDEIATMPNSPPPIAGYVRGGQSYSCLTIDVASDDMRAIQKSEKFLLVFVEARYQTSLDRTASYITRNGFVAIDITGDVMNKWTESNPVQMNWMHSPSYYCFDDDCDT